MPLFAYEALEYSTPTLREVDWGPEPRYVVEIVRNGNIGYLDDISTTDDIDFLLRWLLGKGERAQVRTIYDYLSRGKEVLDSGLSGLSVTESLMQFLIEAPFLASQLFDSASWAMYKDTLQEGLLTRGPAILRKLVLLANTLSGLVLGPFRRIVSQLRYLSLQSFAELLELIALTVRSHDLAFDFFKELQNETSRVLVGRPLATEIFAQQLYGLALDHIDEVTSAHSMRDDLLQLTYKENRDGFAVVECHLRIDVLSSAALKMGDHIRLTAASSPRNAPIQKPLTIDGIVETSQLGTISFRCLQQPPSYIESCSWKLQNCGSFVSCKTMIDTMVTLHTDREACCRIYGTIYGGEPSDSDTQLRFQPDEELNDSQNDAIGAAMSSRLSLLWGPPGTGKTRTVVGILRQLLEAEPKKRILVAAPTHNAVDNILRKFVDIKGPAKSGVTPIRVSTDVSAAWLSE